MTAVGVLQILQSANGADGRLGTIRQTKDEVTIGVMASLVSWFDPDPYWAPDGLVVDRGDKTMSRRWYATGPVVRGTGISGQPTLSLSGAGSGQFNSSGPVIPAGDFTVSLMVKAAENGTFQFFCGSQGSPYLALGRDTANRPMAYVDGGEATFTTALMAGQAALLQLAYQAAGSKVRVAINGAFAQPYSDYFGDVPDMTRFDWQIGAAGGGGSPCKAEIGQQMIHSLDLANPANAAEQARVVSYYAKKYPT